QRYSFNQKLRENVGPVRADRHAHADFACALGHADQHDVHDSDSADYERYAGDGTKQKCHHFRRSGGRFGDFLLSPHGKVLFPTLPYVMTLSKSVDTLLLLVCDLDRI